MFEGSIPSVRANFHRHTPITRMEKNLLDILSKHYVCLKDPPWGQVQGEMSLTRQAIVSKT